ncbi:MAG: chemotaxis protein CheW [Rhodospirillales bacterium]|jgi:purine-binding chemotaxis protein CheW|nr:chemotaxis protein CheW [Magnetospirillum sp.]
MSNALVPADKGTAVKTVGTNVANDFVTMTVAEQLFGIPVLTVQDVLGPQRITRVPLAPPEVAGALNLRGRIVTACDVRRRLGLPKREGEGQGMNVVVDHKGELYALMVDSVGEVLSLSSDTYERNPNTLDPRWREVSGGIYRLKGKLLVVLEVDRLLAFKRGLGSEAA